jgi:hypothetical protein
MVTLPAIPAIDDDNNSTHSGASTKLLNTSKEPSALMPAFTEPIRMNGLRPTFCEYAPEIRKMECQLFMDFVIFF